MLATSKRTYASLARRFSSIFLALSLLVLCLNAALPVNVQAADSAWLLLDPMSAARSSHTATLLLNGKVLVAGGKDSVETLKTASLYDPIMNTWNALNDMTGARYAHTATLLQNGKVLMVGGSNDTGALTTTELYDPTAQTWANGPVLSIARFNHTATLLSDGTVLVIGGQNSAGDALDSVVLYTPATTGPGTWTPQTNLTIARYAHTATLLPDGKVLVVGGKNTAGDSLTDVAIYDPSTNVWVKDDDALELSAARAYHTAVLLRTGKVLVAGGEGTESDVVVYRDAVLYDPSANTWTATSGAMNTPRSGHTATLTPVGTVLIVGGLNDSGTLAGAEFYNPVSDTWPAADVSSMSGPRQSHTAILLPFGDILVVGGNNGTDPLNSVNLFRPSKTDSWTLTGSLIKSRYAQESTLLLDGRVLVTGGQDTVSILKNADIYNPVTGSWTEVSPMTAERIGHTATLLPDGRVLVVGGQTAGEGQYLQTAEIYDPNTDTWLPTGPMSAKRSHHTATLLPDGRVVIVGGINRDAPLATTEIYSPFSGRWQSGGNITPARYSHTATLMANDSVLIVGGQNYSGYVAQTQLYIPSSAGYSWWNTSGTNLNLREGHSSILLPNGKVLVVGGNDPAGNSLSSCELYNPAALLSDPPTDPWSTTGSLNTARTAFGMALLPNGKVLVAGGFASSAGLADQKGFVNGIISAGSSLRDVEIYDPLSGFWTTMTNLDTDRRYPTATLLPNGQVLVAAGLGDGANTSTELYNMFGTSAFNPAWRPTLADIPSQKLANSLELSGTQFRGFQLGEDAGGATASSATNYPLVQLRRIDNNQVRWATLDAQTGFSDTTFKSTPLSTMLRDPAPLLVTVYVNGIPSEFKSLKIELLKNFTPIAQRISPIKKYFVPAVNR